MKKKLLNLLLILSSLFGFLEWGSDRHMFLYQAEGEVLTKLFTDPMSVIHPLTLFPLVGQLILLITLFQQRVSSLLTYLSIAGLGILLTLMLFVGIISLNYKIILSTLPFIGIAWYTVLYHRKTTIQ
jgi:hypothetical protein